MLNRYFRLSDKKILSSAKGKFKHYYILLPKKSGVKPRQSLYNRRLIHKPPTPYFWPNPVAITVIFISPF